MSMGGGGEVKETSEERALAQIASDMTKDFDTRWKPIRGKLIADIKDAEPERRQAMGIANAESKTAFGAANPKVEAAQTLSGARPGSGRFALSMGKLARNEGVSSGAAQMDATQATDDARTAGMLSLAQMGRGEQSQAIRGLSDVADMSSRQAYSDAARSLEDAQALQSAAGIGAGIGLSSYYSPDSIKQRQINDPQSYAIGGIYGPKL